MTNSFLLSILTTLGLKLAPPKQIIPRHGNRERARRIRQKDKNLQVVRL